MVAFWCMAHRLNVQCFSEKSETRVPMIESNTQDPVDRQEDRVRVSYDIYL